MSRPPGVDLAHDRAAELGFPLSCEDVAGALLATLAAAVPRGGRILELGTGAGVGLAWIVSGLGERTDVEVHSVDLDTDLLGTIRRVGWPAHVQLHEGDGAHLVATLGRFDLLFADAPGGKLSGLEATIAALAPSGVLLVDDMDLDQHADPELRRALQGVRDTLVQHPQLVSTELAAGSGLILCARSGAG